MFVALAALIGVLSYRVLHRDRPDTSRAGAEGIPWQTDLDAAFAESKKTGKPVLVDFSAASCPPCQEMKHNAWPDVQVRKIVDNDYIPVLMDADQPESGAPAQRYGIDPIPAILILDSNGKVIRQGAFMSKDELLDFLRKGMRAG